MELSSVVERAFANREKRIKAKKPVDTQAEAQAEKPVEAQVEETPPPQQPKSLQDDAGPCPAGDPSPGGRAESPCDFPAVERSVSATDATNRLLDLHEHAREVVRMTDAIRDAIRDSEHDDCPGMPRLVRGEIQVLKLMIEEWMDELNIEYER